LFWGLEMVADRSSKQWFDPALKLHTRIKREAMALGLMVYPMGGTVDGRCGDHILLAPAFITSEDELALIVERLAQAIKAAVPA
jgi:adenosylmethionine-8-amino-7-oxononanoate aminotransferase